MKKRQKKKRKRLITYKEITASSNGVVDCSIDHHTAIAVCFRLGSIDSKQQTLSALGFIFKLFSSITSLYCLCDCFASYSSVSGAELLHARCLILRASRREKSLYTLYK